MAQHHPALHAQRRRPDGLHARRLYQRRQSAPDDGRPRAGAGVVFESGLLHFADRTSAYRELPPAPQQLLKAIPVAWDETRLLGGYPGKWLVVARRHGADWYLGGINGQDQPQQVALDWQFLADGNYTLRLIEDGARDRSFADRQADRRSHSAAGTAAAAARGFVGELSPSAASPAAGR